MPKNAKAINVTLEELETTRDELRKEIQAVVSSIGDLTNTVKKNQQSLHSEAEGVQKNVDKANASCAAAVESAIDRAKADLSEFREETTAMGVRANEKLARTSADLESKACEGDAAIRTALSQELESVCTLFDQELKTVRAALEELIAKRAQEAEDSLIPVRKEAVCAVDELRSETKSHLEDLAAKVAADIAAVVASITEEDAKRDDRMRQWDKDLAERIEQTNASLKAATETLTDMQHEADRQAHEHLSKVQQEANESLGRLNKDIRDGMDDVRATISDVENMPTKKVEWVIKDANKHIKAPEPTADEMEPYSSWFSPRFDAAGARGLQLELRVYGYVDHTNTEDKGDCAVFLRAAKGTNIAFRLSIGPHSQVFERKFHGADDKHGTSRLCFFRDHIILKSDTLVVGVEVLESICCLDKSGGQGKPVDGMEQEESNIDCSLKLYRHINNRVLSQVKGQVEHFKSLCVRKVEWRLEEASSMRRCYPKGAPIASKEFDAAGVAGLQLIFYPGGHDTATEGFCSLFMQAPFGATLRCHLHAGRERRELVHTWDKPGQFGRTNFCRFDSCVDEEQDVVLLTCEIEDAHQDLIARLGHLPPANSGLRSLEECPPTECNGSVETGSALKLQSSSRNLPRELEEVKVLPSLWASRSKRDTRVDAARSLIICQKDKDHRMIGHRSLSQTDFRRRTPSAPRPVATGLP